MTADRTKSQSARLPGPQFEKMDALADSIDVDTSPAIVALVDGAFATGQAARLVEIGLRDKPTKRRARPRLPWKSVDGVDAIVGGAKAAVWVYGAWKLTRRGDAHGNRGTARTGDGWYLTGPGCDPACYLGINRGEAQTEADSIIRRYQNEAAAIVNALLEPVGELPVDALLPGVHEEESE